MRGDKCTRGRRPEFQSPTTPCISAKPRVGGSLSRGFDPWQSEAGSGEGRGTRGPCKRSTRESDLGGAPCAASGPWANLALLGGEGSSCEKGMVSANQILEIVVTPKAAEKGKKVALAGTCTHRRMLCKLKGFFKHHKVVAAHRVCFQVLFEGRIP